MFTVQQTKQGSRQMRRTLLLGVFALVAAACTPTFFIGSSIDTHATGPNTVRIGWNTAYDADYPDSDHLINHYEVLVDGVLVASPTPTVSYCLLSGLAGNTTYDIEVTAVTSNGERGDAIPALGVLSTQVTTPAGGGGGAIACDSETDSDGDRIPDVAETNTGIYIDKMNTGTDPNLADSDLDGLSDGDEVSGTIDGLGLNQMGANPNHQNVFLEIDWFDDSLECGAHSHRPTAAMVDRMIASFAAAPIANPDGTTGIDMIVDYGQGPPFNTGGSLVDDISGVDGNLVGGVNSAEYGAIKNANFHAVRENYFHYALHVHRYNSSSTSSGQAEIDGDDQIVSLYCFESLTNTSNTMMHELGHNLGLRHGGNVSAPNRKPNYNSIMNYAFQFPGVDNPLSDPGGCDAAGDQVLDYSAGTRFVLNELALLEPIGVCGLPIDWNGNTIIDAIPVVANVNGDALFDVLADHNDWAALNLASVSADGADGARISGPEVIEEQPVPTEFQN